jgi:hypothetical protein
MKFFAGSLAAGLVLLAGSAQAQLAGPYRAVSDVEAPYAVAPRPVPPPYGPELRDGYGPSLLPSTEVYFVLRDNGFSPLGIPRLRGFVYTIAVLDRDGSDGRLVIDARNGRILRFMPASRIGGDNYYEEHSSFRGPMFGPLGGPPRQAQAPDQAPQAQAPDQVQTAPQASRPAHLASRAVPMPKASPLAAKPAPAAPVQQAAAPAPKSAEVEAAPATTTGAAPAKPAPSIAPTEDMPKAQGLE